jgi:hypothetical protein
VFSSGEASKWWRVTGRFGSLIRWTASTKPSTIGLYRHISTIRSRIDKLEPLPQDRVPLFLSEYDQPYDQDGFDDEGPDYTFGSKQEKPRTARLVIGLVAVTAFAATVGYFSIDTMRSVLVNAKASLASVAPTFGDATPSEPAAPPPRVARSPHLLRTPPKAQAVYRGRPPR